MTQGGDTRHWRPAASLERLRARAELLRSLRGFFERRGVLEVETPILSRAATTDPQLESFHSRYLGPHAPHGCPVYLHTSPEFPMKRLLAAGSGPIYQICHVFRQGERGRRHNPEFTLLEWYRPGYDHHRLMDEVEELATEVLAGRLATGPAERLSYAEAFERHAGIDPHTVSASGLKACALAHEVPWVEGLEQERDAALDLLLSQLVEPALGRERLCFLYDYPPSQASLARVREGNPPLAERFELYFQGVELANGFHELGDSVEQRRRFEQDNAQRHRGGSEMLPLDEYLLSALHHGLPDCAGVALGVDRLLMLSVGAETLEEVLAFPIERA